MPHPPEAPARLRRQQEAFAAHLRDPANAAAPEGVEERRLAVYRDLFQRNVEALLANNFPVLRALLADAWQQLVRDFYREHRAQTPLFPEIGREFLRYLEARSLELAHRDIDHPFLLELAHYEWVELALTLHEADPADVPHRPDGDLLEGIPVASPLAWPLAYRWPVQRIGPDHVPTEQPPQPTFLLVVRDRAGTVRFKQTGAVAFQLMQRLHANADLSGRAVLAAMAAECGAETGRFIADGAALLQQLRDRDAILGCR